MKDVQEEEAKQNPAEEDDEEEKIEDADPEERARSKIWQELDCIDSAAKEGYVNERYNYAYSEYKRGLKSLSDLVIGREAREDPELKAKYMERRRKVREEKMILVCVFVVAYHMCMFNEISCATNSCALFAVNPPTTSYYNMIHAVCSECRRRLHQNRLLATGPRGIHPNPRRGRR